MRTDGNGGPPSRAARLAHAALLFFLVKGLLWLALPAWWYLTR
jgi:hypothetical protein